MSTVKVTIYEAKETIVNIEFPICFRSEHKDEKHRYYVRFESENSCVWVYPNINSIQHSKYTTVEECFRRNMRPVQDEIFEAKLDETLEAISSDYALCKVSIQKQYDTEAQKENAQEKRDSDALDNHRNH